GYSLLEYASEKKDEALVDAIIKRIESVQFKAGTTSKRDFKTESLIKAAEKGYISMIELLINHGANINGTGRWEGETPIIKASYYGQTNAVKWLIDHGANIEARDGRGNTALLHAAWT